MAAPLAARGQNAAVDRDMPTVMKSLRLSAALFLAAALSTASVQAHPVVDAILAKYGADALKNAKEIRFTFMRK